jgi:hypothetical protein
VTCGATKRFPKIRLQGKWLEQLGFKPNGRVRIVPLADGELVLKFVDEQEKPIAPRSSQLNEVPPKEWTGAEVIFV